MASRLPPRCRGAWGGECVCVRERDSRLEGGCGARWSGQPHGAEPTGALLVTIVALKICPVAVTAEATIQQNSVDHCPRAAASLVRAV